MGLGLLERTSEIDGLAPTDSVCGLGLELLERLSCPGGLGLGLLERTIDAGLGLLVLISSRGLGLGLREETFEL